MRRAKIVKAEDLHNLPDGEWVHVPGGIHAEFIDDDVRVELGRLLIKVPNRAVRRFRLSEGDRLRARFVRGRLVVEHEQIGVRAGGRGRSRTV